MFRRFRARHDLSFGFVPSRSLPRGRRLGIALNVAVFCVVKAAMEYSKSPKTPAQRGVGFVCNLFRRLNVVSPAAPVVVVLAVLVLAVKAVAAVAAPLAGLF